ncbi:hypothetical protein [cyanobacterium endosymbiont of Rhopalodia gibberula]|uniref:hypothetical protein n=1 Tax=cyanobacterium endosymbiont of Rhopalodia gibberula TaxID=1763363 RepID=UPI001559170D|nr:hypothetical protein [cyanobacterium endosymbiont of Rhopalodia gibberula]
MNTLVRSKIPEIIEQPGNRLEVRTLSAVEYLQSLKNKLIKESQEPAQANSNNIS